MNSPFSLFGRIFQRETGPGISTNDIEIGKESHIIVSAGVFTTVGGDANESISVPVIETGDIVSVVVQTPGAVPRTITSFAVDSANGQIDVVMSDDPDDDHVLSYQVLRSVPEYTE